VHYQGIGELSRLNEPHDNDAARQRELDLRPDASLHWQALPGGGSGRRLVSPCNDIGPRPSAELPQSGKRAAGSTEVVYYAILLIKASAAEVAGDNLSSRAAPADGNRSECRGHVAGGALLGAAGSTRTACAPTKALVYLKVLVRDGSGILRRGDALDRHRSYERRSSAMSLASLPRSSVVGMAASPDVSGSPSYFPGCLAPRKSR